MNHIKFKQMDGHLYAIQIQQLSFEWGIWESMNYWLSMEVCGAAVGAVCWQRGDLCFICVSLFQGTAGNPGPTGPRGKPGPLVRPSVFSTNAIDCQWTRKSAEERLKYDLFWCMYVYDVYGWYSLSERGKQVTRDHRGLRGHQDLRWEPELTKTVRIVSRFGFDLVRNKRPVWLWCKSVRSL